MQRYRRYTKIEGWLWKEIRYAIVNLLQLFKLLRIFMS
jgi:hypothetical protein